MNGRLEYRFDPQAVETPAFVLDEGLLRDNLDVLASVKERAGCKVLLALKCFAMFSVFPMLAERLDGVCASSPHEARLGREEFGPGLDKEVHTFAAGYSEKDIRDLCETSDHIVFNSLAQLNRFRPLVRELAAGLGRDIELAVRINPEHSEARCPSTTRARPARAWASGARSSTRTAWTGSPACTGTTCASRTRTAWPGPSRPWRSSSRTCCRACATSISAAATTSPGQGTTWTCSWDLIVRFKEKWGVEVYLEPGEAVALNAGYLAATVLDVVQADVPVAVMDSAVPCHMPDVIEMPYRPLIAGSGEPGEKPWTCRIGGPSCLAGDVAGEYSFDAPLTAGDKLVFTDMAIYTMVKTNTFNGIRLPSIYRFDPRTETMALVRSFGYEEFRNRLS